MLLQKQYQSQPSITYDQISADLYEFHNVTAVTGDHAGVAGLDDVRETGVEVDVFPADGPDDVDAVLPGDAGDVTQAGIVWRGIVFSLGGFIPIESSLTLLPASRIETRGVEVTSPVILIHQATKLSIASYVETLNTDNDMYIYYLDRCEVRSE